jgi:RNA polymerase sigma factor (sigma-70 family)
MAIRTAGAGIDRLRRSVLREGAGLSDGQLLECYALRRDEAAFAALLRRHGPMVWGVCRRVLGHTHDAEDAFQATFLVLIRKAGAIMPRELVANWLYGVAYHTAIKARALALRRKSRERQVESMPEPHAVERDPWPDLQPILDRELHGLPDKYRAAIVLCDLQGRSYKEAARQLGCPEGTLSARLARGRTMLARRLARHGVAVSGTTLAGTLSRKAATAALPDSVATATMHAAALLEAGHSAAAGLSHNVISLTEGVMKTMLLKKLKVAVAVLAVIGLMGLGAGAVTVSRSHAEPPDGDGFAPPARTMTDQQQIQGAWLMLAGTYDGRKESDDSVKNEGKRWIFYRDKFLVTRASEPGTVYEVQYKLDPRPTPKAIDYYPKDGPDAGRFVPAIYKFIDGLLIVVDDIGSTQRPDGFKVEPGKSGRLMVFGREGAQQARPDEEFLNRVCNELRGSAPTALERRYFNADSDANKRAKGIVWVAGAGNEQLEGATFGLRVMSDSGLRGVLLDRSSSMNKYDLDRFQRLTLSSGNLTQTQQGLLGLHMSNAQNWTRGLAAYDLARAVGVKPNDAAAEDAGFLSRVTLDLMGNLPTPLELQYFIVDKDAKKRQKIVEWLVKSDEYTRHALRKWMEGDKEKTSAKAGGDHFAQLLDRLLAEKKSDAHVLEALTLAALGRYPTESESAFIVADISKQSDRRGAWEKVLAVLLRSEEAKGHAEELRRRTEAKAP